MIRLNLIEDGKSYIMIVDDITRLKELEQESQKIRALFFSSVAHELRTPLNLVIPLSKLLRRYVTDPNGIQILNVVICCSIHLENVIDDALDMSRIENNKFSINPGLFNLENVLQDVMDTMDFQAQDKGITVSYDLSALPFRVFESDQKRYK